MTREYRSETVARILMGFYSLMVMATNQCNGRVIAFAGDRIMSFFSQNNEENTISEAIECALGMQSIVRFILSEDLKRRNFKPKIHCAIGLDYGLVMMGRMGLGQSTDIVLVGNSANMAAKYQNHAGKNETFVNNIIYDNFPEWVNNDHWKKESLDVEGLGTLSGWKSNSYLKM
ncbi:MAG: hypothetical protein HeimC3_39530 [Candidatus Heimdallarchaeota archaeon LC_3]|nr:MAG: hypothetical protein HeimC3_39530 [Candidatus Heimdallarchaeota archaeon LC_3]